MSLALLSLATGILCFLGAIDELSAGWQRPASFGVGLVGLPVSLLMMMTGIAIVTRWRFLRETATIAAGCLLGLTIFGGLMQQVLGGISIVLGLVVPVLLLVVHGRWPGPSQLAEARQDADRCQLDGEGNSDLESHRIAVAKIWPDPTPRWTRSRIRSSRGQRRRPVDVAFVSRHPPRTALA
jgi:hypothetical protein